MKRLLIFLILFVVSCTPQSDQKPILTLSGCALPCWNGIVAGQTNREQLMKVLEGSPFISQDSVIASNNVPFSLYDTVVYFELQRGSVVNQGQQTKGQAWILDNVVRKLVICGNLKTTMGELVNAAGEPEYILSNGNYAGGKDVILINPDIGIHYWYLTNMLPEDLQKEISAAIEIYCLSMFDTSMYDEMLEAGEFSMGFYNKEETLRVMYPWDGYGNLDEKYPPRQP